MPISTSGLPVLGTAAQAKQSTLVIIDAHPIPMQKLFAGAAERARQADLDANLLIHIVETSCKQPLRYAAWLMLVCSLAVRLDFHTRILSSDILTALVTAHAAMLFQVAKHILGLPRVSDIILTQMQLP